MRNLIAALLLLVACNKSSPAKSDMVTKLEGLADAGCACTDWKCVDGVRAQIDDFAKTVSNVSDDDMQPMQAAQARFDACHAKLDPTVIAYQKLSDDICACQDKACGAKVSGEVDQWSAHVKNDKVALNPAAVDVIKTSGTTAAACYQKLGVPLPR